MPKRLLLAGVFLAVVVGVVYSFVSKSEAPAGEVCNPGQTLETRTLSSEGFSLQVEVASTGQEKAQGLSGRNCLEPQTGMLFFYELSGDYCFWMKDMKFAIDMVWLDDEKQIVTTREHVSPDTYPQTFCPDKPARYVIEVVSGKAAEYDWHVGTRLDF